MTDERDNGYDAILKRYDKANLMAISMHDRIAFDSLRDVFFLVNKAKQLEERIARLESELMVEKGKHGNT